VVGARGAAFAPVPLVSGAVVIDGDDEAYRSQAAPTWHAVDVVVERCREANAPWWVSSPLPSPWLESFGAMASAADEDQGWPRVEVADRRLADPRQGVLSEIALREAHRALSGDEPVAVAIVLQRLGRGRLLACASCGELARCAICARAEHEVDGRLACDVHLEGRERFCAKCGSTKLKVVRSGVTTLARDVAAQLGQDVTEITAASEPGATTRVVVGTEAVFARVRRAAVVVFVDFDQYLLSPRSRGRRDAISAVARAGRLSGSRRDGRGMVVLQTRRGDDPVVNALVNGRFDEVAHAEREDAEILGEAPFRAHAEISGEGAEQFVAGLDTSTLSVARVDDGFAVSAVDVETLTAALGALERPPGRLRVAVE
jgi:primosomal protein N' (replication factor Y)